MCRLSVTARRSNMNTLLPDCRLLFVLLTVTQTLFTHCLSINKLSHPDIDAKTKVELKPISVTPALNDVIRISAPMINEQSMYYLNKPNGDVMKLDILSPKINSGRDFLPSVTTFYRNVNPVRSKFINYRKIAMEGKYAKQLFTRVVDKMEDNEFMIGPLTVEDHGNWVLSIFTKDFNDDWIELFQVITITITDIVALTPESPVLNLGDTLNLSFIFPIPKLESCELVAPPSTFDRLYDRRLIDMDKCGFSIPNVTERDTGTWRIVGVGQIVYIGQTTFLVSNGQGYNNSD